MNQIVTLISNVHDIVICAFFLKTLALAHSKIKTKIFNDEFIQFAYYQILHTN